MGRQTAADNALQVSLVVRHCPPSAAQAAAWRRLWEHLLTPKGTAASTEEQYGSAPGTQEEEPETPRNDSALQRPGIKPKCPGYSIMGECDEGHKYAKLMYCGREWCGVCGDYKSDMHTRRFSRRLTKARQISIMGYFVLTIPPELRCQYRSRESLSALGTAVASTFKKFGYRRGLRMWHWFGDVMCPCGKRTRKRNNQFVCEKCGRVAPEPQSMTWHPHLNVIVDGGYLSKERLAAIKKAYGRTVGVDIVDVHYEYCKKVEAKVHVLTYVTRPTFSRTAWDEEMAMELKNFRNQNYWGPGRWNETPVWSLADLGEKRPGEEELDQVPAVCVLESSVCPECGTPIAWQPPLPKAFLEVAGHKKCLGAGYWQLDAG